MNLTITVPSLVMSVTFLVLALSFGRWAGRLQTIVENSAAELLTVRKRVHDNGEDIAALKNGLDMVHEDVGELMHRRKGDK